MARTFTFRLQPVLEQREREEEAQTLRVAELDRQRLAVEARLRDCQRRIIESKLDLRERLGPNGAGVSVTDVRMQAASSLHLAAEAQRTAVELAGAYSRLESSRAELLRATTARKAVELLREKQHAQWKQARARREAAELDEITSGLSARQMNKDE